MANASTGLQLRSTVKKDGTLELSLVSIPTPEPKPEEVPCQGLAGHRSELSREMERRAVDETGDFLQSPPMSRSGREDGPDLLNAAPLVSAGRPTRALGAEVAADAIEQQQRQLLRLRHPVRARPKRRPESVDAQPDARSHHAPTDGIGAE